MGSVINIIVNMKIRNIIDMGKVYDRRITSVDKHRIEGGLINSRA